MSRKLVVKGDIELCDLDIDDQLVTVIEEACSHVNEGLSFAVDIDYTDSDPGKLDGLPEDCYPPEGAEWEVDSDSSLDLALVITERFKHALSLRQQYYLIVAINTHLVDFFGCTSFSDDVDTESDIPPDDDYEDEERPIDEGEFDYLKE